MPEDAAWRPPPAALRAGGALVVALFLWHALRWDLMVDDAFIAFRHVDNWVSGQGLVYNPGERVEGYSSFLWVALLALPARLGVPPAVAAQALGLGAGVATLAMVQRTAVRRLGVPPAIALAGAALLAAHAPFTFWAAAGLESPLFALLMLVLFHTATTPPGERPRPAALLFFLAALLALTRPEGAAAAVVLAVALARDRRRGRAEILAGAAVFVVIVGAHEGFRLAYYGDALPNPYYAKVSPGLATALRGLRYLGRYVREEGVPFLVPAAVAPVLARLPGAPGKAARGLVLVVALYVAFILSVGGDGLYEHRFCAHVAPLLAVAGAVGLVPLAVRLRPLAAAHPHTARLTLALAVAALFVPRTQGSFFAGAPIEHYRRSEARWTEVGLAVGRAAPQDLWIATNVAGKLPFYARRPTLDMLGLCDRVIARTAVEDAGAGYAGHEKANPGYVLGRSPDLVYLSVLDGAATGGPLDRASLAQRLRLTPLHRYAALLDADDFGVRYRPALLRVAGDEQALVFVRRDGPARGIPPEALRVLGWGGSLSAVEAGETPGGR